MKYALVLQWSAFQSTDYDAMIEVENDLVERLSEAHDVDGHDAGSGEVNIFIHTDDPKYAFDEIKTILETHGFWNDIRIAYREVSGSEYTILWPKGLTGFKIA